MFSSCLVLGWDVGNLYKLLLVVDEQWKLKVVLKKDKKEKETIVKPDLQEHEKSLVKAKRSILELFENRLSKEIK